MHVFGVVHHAVQHHAAAVAVPEYTWAARTHANVSSCNMKWGLIDVHQCIT